MPGVVDHDVLGFEVLVQHLQAMEGLEPLGDLFDDLADLFEASIRSVVHPLSQRDAL